MKSWREKDCKKKKRKGKDCIRFRQEEKSSQSLSQLWFLIYQTLESLSHFLLLSRNVKTYKLDRITTLYKTKTVEFTFKS